MERRQKERRKEEGEVRRGRELVWGGRRGGGEGRRKDYTYRFVTVYWSDLPPVHHPGEPSAVH